MDREAVARLVERLRAKAEEWFEMCDNIHEPLTEAAAALSQSWPPSREQIMRAICRVRLDDLCCQVKSKQQCAAYVYGMEADAVLALKPEKPNV